ncbi:MAG: tRNA 4-thiouridine(8) synthase ThiI [Pseudomonadota bacterium]
MTPGNAKKIIGVGLLSGGLDSLLAAKILLDQGVCVTGLSFKSPFFGLKKALAAAQELGIPLIVKDITQEHLKIVKNPRYGYGANMNPCIDCHALMIREAGKLMEEKGYDFIFTGEVLNQRPMSQTRSSLRLVAKFSGYADFLLRPLSARLLPETKPEKLALVDRERLLDIQGRSRKNQLALAREYGLREYSNPAGGCLLTDPNFSRRLKELFDHNPDCSISSIELLKIGRHFRINGEKVVIGRNKEENDLLKKMRGEKDIVLSAEHIPGPVALISGGGPEALIKKVAGMCARYSDAKDLNTQPIIYKINDPPEEISPPLITESDLTSWRI